MPPMNMTELNDKLDYQDLDTPNVSREVLENVRDAIFQILDNTYSPDKDRIKKTTKKLSQKILNESNALHEMKKKYKKMKLKNIAKDVDKARIDNDILTCIVLAFKIGKKNSQPLEILYIIFQKLSEAHKKRLLIDNSFERIKNLAT